MVCTSAMIVVGVTLIFRGAGAPIEPARAVMPGSANLELPQPGRYVILAEEVIFPRPSVESRSALPSLELELTEIVPPQIRGRQIPVEPTVWLDWIYKVLSRGRGSNLGHVDIERPGTFRLEALPSADGAEPRGRGSVLLAFVRPASPGRMLWLLLGFSGQLVFSLRFIVQWLASEKSGRSTIPRAFWYLSMFGSLMILAYAAYTRDPVFILGFAPNTLIYLRNLVLLGRERAAETAARTGARP